MQVNPEDGPPEIYVTWSNPQMTDFENTGVIFVNDCHDLSAQQTVKLTAM